MLRCIMVKKTALLLQKRPRKKNSPQTKKTALKSARNCAFSGSGQLRVKQGLNRAQSGLKRGLNQSIDLYAPGMVLVCADPV